MKPLHLSRRVPLMAALLCFALQAHASVMFSTNYGSYAAETVCYSNVWETSATDANALYGAPEIIGNTLNFNPQNFTAYAEDGAIDKTDGQLGVDVCASSGNFINALQFSEKGDYDVSSLGNSTEADVSAFFFIEVLEVDGVELSKVVDAEFSMMFSPNTDGTFALSGFGQDDGIWTGSVDIDIDKILSDNGILFDDGATKIHVQLDNKLSTLAAPGTTAYIAKKDFEGFSITSIPEPNSLVLIGMASSMIVFVRSRFIV